MSLIMDAARELARKRREESAEIGRKMEEEREQREREYKKLRAGFIDAIEKEFSGCMTSNGPLTFFSYPYLDHGYKRTVAELTAEQLPSWRIAFELDYRPELVSLSPYSATITNGVGDPKYIVGSTIENLFEKIVEPLSWWM